MEMKRCALLCALAFWAGTALHGQSIPWKTDGNAAPPPGSFIGTTDPSPVEIRTNNVEQLEIDAGGRVSLRSLRGGGNSIVGVDSGGRFLRATDPGMDSLFDCTVKLWKANGNFITPDCFIGSTNQMPLRVLTHGQERMRIDDTGRVGIGTSAPKAALHVYAAGAGVEARVESGDANAPAVVGLWLGGGGQSVRLAGISGGFGAGTLEPELVLALNNGSGPASMAAAMRIDPTDAELVPRLGLGMAPLAGERLSVRGSVLAVQDGNASNWVRLGHNGTAGFVEASGAVGAGGASLVVNGGGGRTDFGGVVVAQGMGLGTASLGGYLLAVDGAMRGKSLRVYPSWSDYVFAEGYELWPLGRVKAYIAAEGRLPGMPSAAEVAQEGVDLGEAHAALLAKVEELTLHLIRLEEEGVRLRERVAWLEGRMDGKKD